MKWFFVCLHSVAGPRQMSTVYEIVYLHEENAKPSLWGTLKLLVAPSLAGKTRPALGRQPMYLSFSSISFSYYQV